jgi:hypothetical protein
VADGSETTWSPDKLPEEEDEQDGEDNPNGTLEKSKLVMVATPKAFPFAYKDEPPMGPLGHEDVDTTAQSVDGKLLIIIRAFDFLAKQNSGDSYHKVLLGIFP